MLPSERASHPPFCAPSSLPGSLPRRSFLRRRSRRRCSRRRCRRRCRRHPRRRRVLPRRPAASGVASASASLRPCHAVSCCMPTLAVRAARSRPGEGPAIDTHPKAVRRPSCTSIEYAPLTLFLRPTRCQLSSPPLPQSHPATCRLPASRSSSLRQLGEGLGWPYYEAGDAVDDEGCASASRRPPRGGSRRTTWVRARCTETHKRRTRSA